MLLIKIGDLIHAIALIVVVHVVALVVVARTLVALVDAVHLGLVLGLVVDHRRLGRALVHGGLRLRFLRAGFLRLAGTTR